MAFKGASNEEVKDTLYGEPEGRTPLYERGPDIYLGLLGLGTGLRAAESGMKGLSGFLKFMKQRRFRQFMRSPTRAGTRPKKTFTEEQLQILTDLLTR